LLAYFAKAQEESMQTQKTLGIIKPDAVEKSHIGEILDRIEKNGLCIIAMKMKTLSQAEAAEFYDIHKERPFFNDLVSFMSSGPVVIMALEGVDAVHRYRQIMGATNPQNAAPGTIRADFAESIDHNAVHGSDSTETAARELKFFFNEDEICPRLVTQDRH